MPHYEINNLLPVMKDVGNGKQPLGTLFETVNLVPNKKTGSLVSRNGYTTGLSAPSGVSTLDKYLTMPITFPSSVDYHGYFFRDGSSNRHICWKPFYHNSSTPATDNNGWVDIAEKVTFTVNAGFLADVTINGSTTNTFVLANASNYGLSTTSNIYKNWVLCLTSIKFGGSSVNAFLIIAYSVTANVATFTLDNIVDTATVASTPATLDKADISEASLQRYFHGDKGRSGGLNQTSYFVPSYISPAGYFTETGIFFSGGAGSTVGYKNIRGGYYSKTFFNSVTANKHIWQGSYFEQAEVFKPDTYGSRGLLKTISQTASYASEVIKNEVDRSLGAGINWASGGGNHSVEGLTIGSVTSMLITNDGAGDATTNHIILSNTYTNALTNAATYKIKIPHYLANGVGTRLYVEINGQTLSGVLGSDKSRSATLELQFTASGTTAPTIKLWMDSIDRLGIYDINVYLYSDDLISLRKGKTIKYYCVYIYDGFERSDPKYLGGKFLTIASPKIVSTLRIRLGEINKRITAIESYATLEDGDTTSNTAIRVAPLYFMHSIPICDSDTGWSFSTSTGFFEYSDTLTGSDFDNASQTWEQRANRIESDSLTCSYNIAENCAGRIFTAQYYDYVDAKTYTNTIRYTNFNKFGVMSPSVLANIDDEFVSYINAGAGTNITTLFERKGELIIGKEASILRIATDQNKSFWSPIVISNSVGVLNDNVMQSLGNTLIWTDDSGIYRWDGGEVELWGDKIWSQFYRDNKTSNQISWIDRYDGSYNLSLNTTDGNYYKLYQNLPFPYYQDLTDNVTHIAVIKDGSVYFATGAGANYLFYTTPKDGTGAASFTTQLRTGAFTLSPNKFVYVKELEIDLELGGTIAGTMIIYLFGDDTQIAAITVVTTSLKRLRIPVPLVPARTHEVKINYGGSPLTSTVNVVYNRIGVNYDEVEYFGDVKNV